MTPAEFLQTLYTGLDSGYIELRLIHRDGGAPKRVYRPLPLDDLDPARLDTFIVQHNRDYHIYYRFGVSMEQRARKSDIAYLTALWLDLDGATRQQAMAVECELLDAAHIDIVNRPPNWIIHSGGGYHCIWRLRKPIAITDETRPAIERTLDGLAIAYGGDRKCKDVTRIFRLPGTVNIKPERNGAVCVVEDYIPVGVDFGFLHDRYAPLAPREQPIIKRAMPTITRDDMPRWVQEYIATGAGQGERNGRLYAAAYEYHNRLRPQYEAENELIPRALADGLEQSEINATIRSAYNQERKPIIDSPLHRFIAAEDTIGGDDGTG